MRNSMRKLAYALAGGITMWAAAGAAAAAWPDRPLTVIVPFGPGSSPDQMVRVVAEDLSQRLGQSVVVTNRAGASGNIGTRAIAQAKADGYTFGVSITGPMVNNGLMGQELGYDPRKDLTPLSLAVHQPNVLVVAADSTIQSMADLKAALQDGKQAFNFPSTGSGTVSHLAVELLLKVMQGQAQHVPYTSSPQALTSLVGHDTQFGALPPVAVMPLVAQGRVRPLALIYTQRSDLVPGVPTLEEQGYPGIEGSGWIGFVAPAGLPADIADPLSQALAASLHSDTVVQRLRAMSMEPVGSTPAQFAQYMEQERSRWAPLIKELKLDAQP